MRLPDRQLNLLTGYGGAPPFQAGSQTSEKAAQSVQPRVGTLRYRVLQFIVSCGLYGATDEEIQDGLRMNGNTERPRRRELEKGRLIVDSGRTRKTRSGKDAVVWVIAHPTQETLT